MPTSEATKLEILLIADDAVRIAALRQRMTQSGVRCSLHRVGFGNQASAYLNRRTPYQNAARPDLVFCDLAELTSDALELVRATAIGPGRASAPVVLLTSAGSEQRVEAGEIDGGESTMFVARALETFLRKLADARREAFLRALQTLYGYGPIIVRLPEELCGRDGNGSQLSA